MRSRRCRSAPGRWARWNTAFRSSARDTEYGVRSTEYDGMMPYGGRMGIDLLFICLFILFAVLYVLYLLYFIIFYYPSYLISMIYDVFYHLPIIPGYRQLPETHIQGVSVAYCTPGVASCWRSTEYSVAQVLSKNRLRVPSAFLRLHCRRRKDLGTY